MENIFVEFLPPWIETGLQPAFYDKESGTVLQQTARMYARVNMLIRMFNKLSKQTKETVEDYINRFNELYNYVHDYFDNLDVQEEINNKLDDMSESGELADIIAQYLTLAGILGYTTVDELANAENLNAGSKAETLGYKRLGDGVYDLYTIRETVEGDEPDGYNLVSLINKPTLVAERNQTGKRLVIHLEETDDLQDYLDLEADKIIYLPATGYTATKKVFVNSDTILDLNNATLTCDYDPSETLMFFYKLTDTSTGYDGNKNIVLRNGTITKACLCLMHNKNVTIKNVNFSTILSRHAIQLAGCYDLTIEDCIFNGTAPVNVAGSECINIDPCNYGGQPYMSEDSPMYDHTPNTKIVIQNNTFNKGTGNSRYTTGVGSHGYDDDRQIYCDGIIIRDNNFGSPYTSFINLCDWRNVTIDNNRGEFETTNVNSVTYALKMRGAMYGMDVINNNFSKCNQLLYTGTDADSPHQNITIANNVVTTLDNTSNQCISLYNTQNCYIKDNIFNYKQNLAYLDSLYSSGLPVSGTYCDNVNIIGNYINKTDATANPAIRIRCANNMMISDNNFAYESLTEPAGSVLSVTSGLDQTNLNVYNNTSKFIFNFMSATTRTLVNSQNNTGLVSISEQYDYTDLSGEADFTIPVTNFRAIVLQIGASAYSNCVEIRPWLLNGDRFDTDDYTWKIPVVKGDNSVGYVTLAITNDGTHYAFSGDVSIRKMYGKD